MNIYNYNEMLPTLSGMHLIANAFSLQRNTEPKDSDVDNRMFYRVETISNEGEIAGGYTSFSQAMLSTILGLDPRLVTPELLVKKQHENMDVSYILTATCATTCIAEPPIYNTDRNNYFCFFSKETFQLLVKADVFTLLDIMAEKVFKGKFRLVYKKFKLKNDDILYEDRYQCVISRDTYEKKNKTGKYHYIKDMEYRSYTQMELFNVLSR